MTVALFLTCKADVSTSSALVDHFCGTPLTFLRERAEVISVDLFVPEPGDVPLFSDGVGPPLIVQIDVTAPANADSLVSAREFSELIMQASAFPVGVEQVQLDIFETIHFPVPGQSTPPPRLAPLSFVVRYYRPTDNEAEFASVYMSDHPPVMTSFPGIRNIVCYLPMTECHPHPFPDSGAFFGNEVVFDSLSALNTALASNVLTELKGGLRRFDAFGYNTHYAMRREQLLTR